MSILDEAKKIIESRGTSYGDAVETMTDAADILCALTGKDFDARDVVLTQIVLKLVRMKHSPENKDHLIDIVGYSEILSRI